MSENNIIEKITTSNLCAGCGLCASVTDGSVDVQLDSDGFMRPTVKEHLSPQQQDLIEATCPGIRISHETSHANYHPLWGPIIEARAGWAMDQELRFKGSSGGAISAMLAFLLESKTVDAILHVGASETQPLLNELKMSRSYADIASYAGSRYSPSAPLIRIKQLLDSSERFAFVGKPCDVAALRNYAKVDSRVDEKVKLMISFMCAGVPSVVGTKNIIKSFGAVEEDVQHIRYRGEGWPGKMKIYLKSGTVHEMSYDDSWGKMLNKHLQFRCKICPDGTGEFADITCADAWYGDSKGYPTFAEREGRSLIITRTKRGKEILERGIKASFIGIEDVPIDINEIEKIQPYQANRKKTLISRLIAMKLLGLLTPSYKNLQLWKVAKTTDGRKNVRNFLGMIRRIILPKLRITLSRLKRHDS